MAPNARVLQTGDNWTHILLADSITAANTGTWFPVGEYTSSHVFAVTAGNGVTSTAGWTVHATSITDPPASATAGTVIVNTITADGFTHLTVQSVYVKVVVEDATTTAAYSVYGVFRR